MGGKLKYCLLIAFLTGIPSGSSARGENPWVPDNGDGTYRNPIIHADYSDPDAIRVGDDYYLVASSFLIFRDCRFFIPGIW
jgi:hypothetical protein